MIFEKHCEEAKATFGEPFEQVHLWLDELAGMPPWGSRHRKFRHHEAGIAEVQSKWGVTAAKVARQHIESDLRLEGWKSGDRFPKDEQEYVRLGFW